MERIYEDPTIFTNETDPPLNAENLNKITNGLAAIDKRVAEELLTTSLAVTESGEKALDAAAGKALNDKIEAADSGFFEVSVILENTASQIINFSQSLSRPPFLVASQINLFDGVWVNLAEISGFTNFSCSAYQIAINKDAAENYVGYGIRFLFKK